MFALSPFESPLFLDADTVVLDRLDFGFEKAERFGLACSICECPWARRFAGVFGETAGYNTGVLFFATAARPVFDACKAGSATVDSQTLWIDAQGVGRGMRFNDQAAFAAVERTGHAPFGCRSPGTSVRNGTGRPSCRSRSGTISATCRRGWLR